MTFSPTEAAFEGFRLTREQPKVVGWWMLACLAYGLIIDTLMAALAGPDLAVFRDFMRDPAGNMDNLVAMGPSMALFDLAAIPVVLGFSALIACAAYRAVLAPGAGRFGYLRTGRDEGRMLLLYLLLMLVFTGVFMAVMIVGAVLMGAAAGAGPAAGMLFGALAFAAMAAGVIYVGVRLSLAGPLTFIEKRISLKDAWLMTRGRFWSLLGAYALSWTLAIVVQMLASAVFMAIGAAASGDIGTYIRASGLDLESVAAVFTPAHLLVTVAAAVLSGLQFAIVLATPAVAYRDLSGKIPARPTVDLTA